jgi:hypothetical protein
MTLSPPSRLLQHCSVRRSSWPGIGVTCCPLLGRSRRRAHAVLLPRRVHLISASGRACASTRGQAGAAVSWGGFESLVRAELVPAQSRDHAPQRTWAGDVHLLKGCRASEASGCMLGYGRAFSFTTIFHEHDPTLSHMAFGAKKRVLLYARESRRPVQDHKISSAPHALQCSIKHR